MVHSVTIGAVHLNAALIHRIKNRLGAREQCLMVCHVADFVPRIMFHFSMDLL